MTDQKQVIKKVIDYIEAHTEEEIRLDRIAKEAGYSKFHLNRMFSEETGLTIYKYIQQRRLTLAAEKLVTTDLPISRIAYEAGYNSQQAFTLAFRQTYQLPPGIYREQGVFTPSQKPLQTLSGSCGSSFTMCLSGVAAA